MTADSMIDYEALAQEAMRSVVRTVLIEAAAKGLPGDHHFYISFDTLAPGVILSKRLREKYAEEMTIVLQHRFWDLEINEHRFEVKLTFDGIPERLVVPFKAIRVFFDPSVRYGLQFETANSVTASQIEAEQAVDTAFDDPFADRDFSRVESSPGALGREPLDRGIGLRPVSDVPAATALQPKYRPRLKEADGAREPATIDAGAPAANKEQQPDEGKPAKTEVSGDGGASAEIVSLDAFRKK